MNNYFFSSFLFAIAIMPHACRQREHNDGPSNASSFEVKTATNKAANSINQLAISLYSELSEKKGNLFFAPQNISTAIGMLYAAASKKTKAQIVQVLNVKDDNINNDFGQLESSLSALSKESSTGYKIAFANNIWIQKNFPLKLTYAKLLKNAYNTKVEEADFKTDSEKERQRINNWVKDKTEEKVSELLSPDNVSAETQLILTNAIYFKGKWQLPFNAKDTKDRSFITLDEKEIKVPMMHRKGEFNLSEDKDDGTKYIEIPYKTTSSRTGLSMVILLPKEVKNFTKLEKQVNEKLNKLEKQVKEKLKLELSSEDKKVSVYLPKFKINSSFQLEAPLKKLGMVDAFVSGVADFSELTKNKIAISKIIHQAVVDVNEEGTEAAAATATVATRGFDLTPTFYADKPFIFLIKDIQSGAILFLGRVVNPL